MDISDCMELCRANGFASLTEAITAARTSKAELEQLRADYQRICRGDARLRQERDEARAEIERLQNQLGQTHARIETDGREIEQLRAALDKAEKHMRSIGFLETADKLKRALEQEAGETKP